MTEYRDVPGWPGYRVGDDGSVWSCKLRGGPPGPRRRGDWQRLALRFARNGYIHVHLRHPGRKRVFFSVHRLVLGAFVGPCPEGMECLHGAGGKSDNRLSNLHWGTHLENIHDAVRLGTFPHRKAPKGEDTPAAKLTDARVREMRSLHATGLYTFRRLARMFGVSDTTASYAIRRKCWRHIL